MIYQRLYHNFEDLGKKSGTNSLSLSFSNFPVSKNDLLSC
jgi:hypothetical protein